MTVTREQIIEDLSGLGRVETDYGPGQVATIGLAIEMLKEDGQKLEKLKELDELMFAVGALDAIRKLLDDGGIPRGTFVDDQVRNLVALFNQRGEEVEKLKGELSAADDVMTGLAALIEARKGGVQPWSEVRRELLEEPENGQQG